MILVLCHPGDRVAVWVADGLAARTGARVEVVTMDALLAGSAFAFRLGSGGSAGHVRLADGRLIAMDDVQLAINRLAFVPDTLLGQAATEDRAYAREEMHAILTGWLATFGARIVNRPHPRALSGLWPGRIAARQMAAAAGLPVADPDTHLSAERFAAPCAPSIVLDGRIFGADHCGEIADAANRFAIALGLDVATLVFSRTDDGPALVRAEPLGDWRIGGSGLLDAMAERAG